MKKKIIVLMLCLSTLCLLIGCANQSEQANAQKENATSATETDAETSDDKSDTENMAATEDGEATDAKNGADTNTSDTSISAEAETETETKPQIPEFDSTKFEDISKVAEALGFSFTPVESFSNGFKFASFGFDKNDNFIINYNKNNPDNSEENMGVTFTITPEEYIYDPDWDEARALEDAVIENIPVKVRLYTHYNCEGDWRSLLTEDELNELMALFETGAAGGGECNAEEASIEIREHYWLRWQQNETYWVCAMSNIATPKCMTLEDLEAVAQEFMQSCAETQPAE